MADPPEEPIAVPPPLVRTNVLADEIADQEAEHQRELLLHDAQEKAKSLRPLFANHVYVEPQGKNLRVSFGDRVGEEAIFHTALVIPLEEAGQFAELLQRMSNAGLRLMWEDIRQALADEQSAQDETNG